MIEKTHGVLRGGVIVRTDTGNTSGLWLSRKSVLSTWRARMGT